MKLGGTVAFWVKIGLGLVALYLVWKVWTIIRAPLKALGEAAGTVVDGAYAVAVRPGSIEEGEGVSAPGYVP